MSSLTADFVYAVEQLDEWLNLTRWKPLCGGEGEVLDICAYKGYNSLLRSFVNTFGTDYMNDATFGDLSDSKLYGDCWLNFDRRQDDHIQGLFDPHYRISQEARDFEVN